MIEWNRWHTLMMWRRAMPAKSSSLSSFLKSEPRRWRRKWGRWRWRRCRSLWTLEVVEPEESVDSSRVSSLELPLPIFLFLFFLFFFLSKYAAEAAHSTDRRDWKVIGSFSKGEKRLGLIVRQKRKRNKWKGTTMNDALTDLNPEVHTRERENVCVLCRVALLGPARTEFNSKCRDGPENVFLFSWCSFYFWASLFTRSVP